MRIGSFFGRDTYTVDETPEFGDTAQYSKAEQERRWRLERQRAIDEGRNKKPMLKLIEDCQRRAD